MKGLYSNNTKRMTGALQINLSQPMHAALGHINSPQPDNSASCPQSVTFRKLGALLYCTTRIKVEQMITVDGY